MISNIEQAYNILEIVAKLKNKHVGIILVTYHLEFAKRISDRIAFLKKGRFADIGGREIMENPKNKRVAVFVNRLKTIE